MACPPAVTGPDFPEYPLPQNLPETAVDATQMDALLSMMGLEELSEALEMIQTRLGEGRLSAEEAAAWEARIHAWEERLHETDLPLATPRG